MRTHTLANSFTFTGCASLSEVWHVWWWWHGPQPKYHTPIMNHGRNKVRIQHYEALHFGSIYVYCHICTLAEEAAHTRASGWAASMEPSAQPKLDNHEGLRWGIVSCVSPASGRLAKAWGCLFLCRRISWRYWYGEMCGRPARVHAQPASKVQVYNPWEKSKYPMKALDVQDLFCPG